jgi:zeaxanthin glucosyltransferase
MKIGFVSMPLTGHLNPMTALARKLQMRGHEVVFIGLPDAEPIVRAADLDFVPICEKEYPLGSVPKAYAGLAKLHGEEVLRYSCSEMHPGRCKAALEQLPDKIRETGVEAMVIDTVHFFVELAPISMGIPYVHIWNILHLDRSGSTPPAFFSWPYERTPEAIARNVELLKRAGSFFAPVLEVAKAYAQAHGLNIDWSNPSATISKLAVITQTPREFDFPGIPWPSHFRYAGPFYDGKGRAKISFPWAQLTGDPLIYASMGTLVNGLEKVFRTILDAAAEQRGTQLVLSVGNNIKVEDLGTIPANAIVVPKAPQIELLQRAALCITHAGMNTALECLAEGVPMVAIPIGFDQPGVASRIAYHGVGEFTDVDNLTTELLSQLMQTVLKNPDYKNKARYFQKIIRETRGLDIAADVIEQAFQRNQATEFAQRGPDLSRS